MGRARDIANVLSYTGDLATDAEIAAAYVTMVAASTTYLTRSSASNTYIPQSSPVTSFKNKIINGGFDIWQRATSLSSTTTGDQFLADRFFFTRYGTGTYSASRQAFTPGNNIINYESQYFLRLTTSVAGDVGIAQKIEDVRTLAGQTATLSFWAKTSSNSTIQQIYFIQNFGSGGSTEVVSSNSVSQDILSTTSSWTRYTSTVNIPSISGKTVGTSSSLMIRIDPSQSFVGDFDIWGIQLEKGSIATEFEQRFIGDEIRMCQRYYHQDSLTVIDGYASAGMPLVKQFYFPVKMRISPASTTTQTGSVNTSLNTSNTTFTIDPPTSNENFINMYITATAAGRTHLYRPVQFNAEL
jgi:hypothetical protein